MLPTLQHPALARTLDLAGLMARKSHFLLGPRQTGKSFLVGQSLPGVRVYDLLDSTTFLRLTRDPGLLAEELRPDDRFVVIDEIQRLPELLNEVHRLIESRRIHFLVTGSSARKLRSGGVNLLGGRARTRHLHPLTWLELGPHFELNSVIRRGTLPSMYFSDDPGADLQAYCGSYLQQEIVAEGALRNVPAFSRFLRVAALGNATVTHYTGIASDAQVARTTVNEYFEILKDTLVIHELPAWRQTQTRKPTASAKHYFFDVGVVGALQGRKMEPGTPEYGFAVETYVMHELTAWSSYISQAPLAFWRSTSGYEVDFILGGETAVEVKAKQTVSVRDLRSLHALAEEKLLKRLICVTLEPRPRTTGGIELLPLADFLAALWGGEFGGRAASAVA